MKIKKHYLFIVAILLTSLHSKLPAQVVDNSTPPSFEYQNNSLLRAEPMPYMAYKTFEEEDLKKEDAATNKLGMPLRIAQDIAVDLDIDKTGTWSTLSNGQRIWQQTIQSPDANGLILSFDELYIPEGAKLYLYTADKSQVIGAYITASNPKGGQFASPILYQDEVVLEYVESSLSAEKPRVKISAVGYVYNLKQEEETNATSYSCMVNINCEEGDNWQKQKKGVVALRMHIGGSWYICSGSLVNNARQDKSPYILTADHCIWNKRDTVNFETMQFQFFKEREGCTPITTTESSTTRTLSGAELLVDIPLHEGSDGVLLKLNNSIPSDWNVYYNGWDATNTRATNGVCIHHPNGYVKTISTYTKTLGQTNSYGVWMGDTTYTAGYAHWTVSWAQTTNGWSVTAGGSSGSPLFNQDGLIVGTLTGGNSVCGTVSSTGTDYYGKMWYHWNQYSDRNQRMKIYLDPDDTGITKLEGFEVNPQSRINMERQENRQLVIFPNPIENVLNISASSIVRNVAVYDISGRLVYKESNNNASTISIPSELWTKGIYSVLVETDLGIFKEKVIK